jgi:NAD(P)-dependent dehydrogenase (short-subunit alcohol dehydrogenase family)
VLGGSGAVGREVVRALAAAGCDVAFTYRRGGDVARALAAETGARAIACELADPAAVRALCAEVGGDAAGGPSILVHAAVASRLAPIGEVTDDDWAATHAVNLRAPYLAVQAMLPALTADGGDVVLIGALDRAQSVPTPAHFAATQGALPAMAMAMARELGGRGVRVNVIAVGLLDAGLGRELGATMVADYRSFSALRRLGSPREVAAAVAWLARENTYMNGKILPVNGGL